MAAAHRMVTVPEAKERAGKVVERDQRQWAATGGEDVRLEIVLHPPTEREAQADLERAIAWTRSWRAVESSDPVAEVEWIERQWPSAGRQSVPQRCVLVGADTIAQFAGASVARGWRTLRERVVRLREAFTGRLVAAEQLAVPIRTHARTIQGLAESDFVTLIDVVSWLANNPSSGSRVRQLPIRGIDTKWLERHRAIVEALHRAVTGVESLGLIAAPPLVRMRVLDPALRPGGLCDITAPVEQLAKLDFAPTVVFVFENLETVLAMPDLSGAVVVHGSGYAARQLRQIPWIQTGRVIYWGDLDSDGFAILHALRSGCENVSSLLMDEATLYAYQDLWVPETKAAPGVYSSLTVSEQATLAAIRSEGNVRLEQERVEWSHALAMLTTVIAQPLASR